MVASSLSVITPSLNQAAFLEETILSVLEQAQARVEYILIDGGSTDGSLEIIRRYASRLSHWVSEPDRGQADAINKGFRLSRGRLLGWINSDDLLLPGAAEIVCRAHERNPGAILLGDVLQVDEGGRPIELIRQSDVTLENMVRVWRRGWSWHQPGTFVPRALWQQAGELDTTLRFLFDRDWMCRLLLSAPVVYLGIPVAAFRIHPGSKTVREAHHWSSELFTVGMRYSHLVAGVTEKKLRAGSHLAEAILGLACRRRTAVWKSLARSLGCYPGLAFSPGFLRNLGRSLIPTALLRSLRRARQRKSLEACPQWR